MNHSTSWSSMPTDWFLSLPEALRDGMFREWVFWWLLLFFNPHLLRFNKEKNVVKKVFIFLPLFCFLSPSCSAENPPFCGLCKSSTVCAELWVACQDMSHIPESQRDWLTLTDLLRKNLPIFAQLGFSNEREWGENTILLCKMCYTSVQFQRFYHPNKFTSKLLMCFMEIALKWNVSFEQSEPHTHSESSCC